MNEQIKSLLLKINNACEEIEQAIIPFIRDNHDSEGNIIDQTYAQKAFGILLILSDFKNAQAKMINFIEDNDSNCNDVFISNLRQANKNIKSSVDSFKLNDANSAERINCSINLLTLIEESIKTNSSIVSMLAASLNVAYKD